jgi:DNA processing protein
LKSGALITSEQALENGRLVYAVPGQIDRPTSFGTNRLIQQGAKLVTCAGDILDDLNSLFPELRMSPPPAAAEKGAVPTPSSNLNTEEIALFEALGTDTLSPEDLADKTGLPMAKVSSSLLTLELKRLVRQLPGRQFVKLATATTPGAP